MEDGLVHVNGVINVKISTSLNPYCSGRWSRTGAWFSLKHLVKVLILIVVEDGLVRSS